MSWTAPALFNALKSRMEGWDGLSGVDVYTAPPEKAPQAGDAIVFLRARGEQDWAALGNQSREDRYTIECLLLSVQNGLGEENAVAARDRVGEVMAAVSAGFLSLVQDDLGELAEEIGATQLLPFRLANITLTAQGAESTRRGCLVDFDIQVQARI